MSDRKKTRIKSERRVVPESAICYVGPAFVYLHGDQEFIVIAKDDRSLRFAWSLLRADEDLDDAACQQLAAFEYKSTK